MQLNCNTMLLVNQLTANSPLIEIKDSIKRPQKCAPKNNMILSEPTVLMMGLKCTQALRSMNP
jgi:hypothetical protein